MKVKGFSVFSITVVLMLVAAAFGVQQALAFDFKGSPAAITSPWPAGLKVGVSETGLYIIKLADASLAAYQGGIAGLAATSPQATGARKLDVTSHASVAYLDYLQGKQDSFIALMESTLGRPVEVAFQYLNVFNGLAVRVSAEEAASLAKLPGVSAVYADTYRQLDTEIGPTLIGAPAIWNGDTTNGLDSKGEGIVIGLLDTGINHAHPSFADPGPVDGYNYPAPGGGYLGYCVTDDPSFCNDKLIGAYDFTGHGTPEDSNGHGSHTSSTAGGNYVDVQVTEDVTVTISGVAPHANIIMYRVCDDSGCGNAESIAAVNQAITDGADVLNYSISGGDNPWNDSVDQAFLDAYAAGIFVSASAGNNGPGPETVAHTGPWNASVAASTHSRVVANTLDVTDPTPVPSELLGLAAVPDEGTVLATDLSGEIRYDPDNLDGCAAFEAGYFTDAMALIQRGNCNFTDKVANAYAAGATAVVVFNNVGGPPITMGGGLTGTPPAVMLDLADGTAVKDYIDLNDPTPVSVVIYAEMSYIVKTEWQDIMAGFSSRGPSQFELLKPDYDAPGVNILAAVAAEPGDPAQFGYYQGTSMSSPHGAGAAALMMAINPGWSPAEIRSAMATTANNTDIKDSDGVTPADPYDMGSGRLDLQKAGNAGLVLDETYDNYVAANPDIGGEPNTLNQPSMVEYECFGSCSWTRVVSSTLSYSQQWDVSTSTSSDVTLEVNPTSFILGPGDSQTIVITATPNVMLTDYFFGEVMLTPAVLSLGAPSVAHLPVVLGPEAPIIDIEPESLENAQLPDKLEALPLTVYNLGGADLEWEFFESDTSLCVSSDWYENFDSYAPDSQMHGQGGWKGWGNNPDAGALVSTDQAHSPDNSVAIVGASDLVHEYSGYNILKWTYTAWQYVPSDMTGQSYFILLNTYSDDGSDNNWSTQVHFDAVAGLVVNEGAGAETLPLITDQWVELRVEIDLTNDIQDFYYDDQLLYSGSWTEGLSGGGAYNIGAVDLFANGASVVYYDDISLVLSMKGATGDVDWLSTDPTSGVTPGGESSEVSVGFDSTGLNTGIYTGTLCALSNDPNMQIVAIPVTMKVEDVFVAKDAPETAYPGDIFTYTVTMDWTDAFHGSAVLTDALPAGVEYVSGTLAASFGDAWYDDGDNAIYWTPGFKQTASGASVQGGGAPVALMINAEPVDMVGTLAEPKVPDQAVELVLDDGSPEIALGVGGTWEFLCLNRYTPDAGQFPFLLNEIWVAFVSSSVHVGDDILLVVYQDADSDPTNGADLLATYPAQVMEQLAFNVYTLDTPLLVTGPGDVLVGFIPLEVPGTSYYPGPIDNTSSQQRSWIGFWSVSPPPDPPTLPPDDGFYLLDDIGWAGNWMVRGYGEQVVVPQTISVTFQVEVTANPGEDIANLATLNYNGDAIEGEASTHVPWDHGVLMTPEADAMSGDPGTMVEYTLTVTNTGNFTDTITLDVADAVWDTQLSDTSLELGVGEAADVTVQVTVPADAMAGDMDMATIRATTTNTPLAFVESELTTTANAVYGFELMPLTEAITSTPGSVVTYTLTITNLANITDTFALTYTAGWETMVPMELELASGESAMFEVLVTIPTDAMSGDSDMAVITVTSVGDGSEAMAELTTTAYFEVPPEEGYWLYLPITFVTR